MVTTDRPQGFAPENLDYLGIKPLGSCQRNLNSYGGFVGTNEGFILVDGSGQGVNEE